MNVVFKNLECCSFSKFIFVVRFDIIRLRRHICMTQGSSFIANKERNWLDYHKETELASRDFATTIF